MKSGMRSRCSRSSSWSSGYSARYFERGGEEPSGGLLTGGEEERRRTHDRGDLGRGAVGVLGERQVGEDVGPRLAASVFDVGREVVVEPGQGVESRPALARPAHRPFRASPKPSRNRWKSDSGTPSRSATTSMAKGWE